MTPRDGWFRFTDTGIPATDRKSFEILESVIGQLSDGIWENSPGMGKYWKNLHIDTRDGNIIINETYNSPFRLDDQKKVLEFFANKVKQIIKTEIEDGRSDLEWKRDCTGISDYLGYKEQITVRDAYKVYDQLKGRKPRIKESKKLSESGGKMTANQWVNAISRASRCPKDAIEFLFGEDLVEIKDFIIGAKTEKEFEDALETFADDIDIRIKQLKSLRDHLYEVPYDKI